MAPRVIVVSVEGIVSRGRWERADEVGLLLGCNRCALGG